MGLHEDGVDLLKVDDFGLIPHGLDHGTNAEVLYAPEDAFGHFYDEVEGFIGKGVVRESDAIELSVNELGKVLAGELVEFGGVGDAGFEVIVDPHLKGGVKLWLPDEDEVVVLGEVL